MGAESCREKDSPRTVEQPPSNPRPRTFDAGMSAEGKGGGGNGLAQLVGLRIKVKMAPPLVDEHVGDLFAYDEKTKSVALQKQEVNNNITFTILKEQCIASVECLSSTPNPQVVDLRLPTIDMDRLKQKELRALESEHKKMEKIGTNVSQMAQDIFDGLSFTLPCVWAGQCIQLPDIQLELRPPYTEDAVSSMTGADEAQGMEYFKKVLRKVRETLGL